MYKAKILVLGPLKCGKTFISNVLSDSTERGQAYHPTQGVRILEFEVPNIDVQGRQITAEIELWDVSGDRKYEACWPAIAKDTSGVLFVYNPDLNNSGELETWYSYFSYQQNLRDNQCLVLAHLRQNVDSETTATALPEKLENVPAVTSIIDRDAGDQLRDDFARYLSRLFRTLAEKREQEEMNIMGNYS